MLGSRRLEGPDSTALVRSAALAVVVSVCLAALASGAKISSSTACRRSALAPAPAWIGSAAWSADGSRLVLTEPLGPSLLVFGEDGRFLRRVDGSAPGNARFSRPSYLSAVAGGLLMLDAPQRLLWLDDRYAPVRSVDGVTQPGLGTVGALYSWAATSRSTIYGYGDVETSPRRWRSGYLRLSTSPTPGVEILRETRPETPEHASDFCRATYPCAASAGEKGYFLVQVDPPRIEQAGSSLTPLAAFPAAYRRLPKLPRLGGAQGLPHFMKALEQSALAVAVYGRGEHVFVLTRKPLGNGDTRWELVQIDPQRDAIVGTKVLPTTARHLTLAPGPRWWAIVEKGSVEAAGRQPVLDLLLVPTPWIESTSSPIAAGTVAPPRCEATP